MKTSLKRLFAVILALSLLVALGATAFAEEGDAEQTLSEQTAPVEALQESPQPIVQPISVEMPSGNISLKISESVNVTARVSGEGSGATYTWLSSDRGVVTVNGSKNTATLAAVGSGRANVTLTVTGKDGRSNYARIDVNVAAASTPVSVDGGAKVTVSEGESKMLSAGVSGGSGSYEFYWETDGSGVLNIANSQRNNAEVYAGRAGSGTVLLTVYDAEDRTNNATAKWNFTVEDKQQVEAPSLEMNRGSVDLGTGGSGSLMLNATGGSGSYDYIWRSDNPGAVSVVGNSATADIRAAAMVIPGANRAEISAYVRDRQSGLLSNTVTCVVTVSGGNAAFNDVEYAKVGDYVDFGPVSNRISDAFRRSFGSGVSGNASVRFTNPISGVGSIRFQDGAAVKSGTSYSFYTFQTLLFRADAAGEFSTAYMITDGGNTIEGEIRVTVTGGVPVKGVTLNHNTVSMYTYSDQSLSLTVSPAGAAYNVTWETSNTNLLTISGSGNKVLLKTNGNTGAATVTATVYDSNGQQISRTCNVMVLKSPSSSTPNVTFDTALSVTLGSDYYGSKLADSMISKFKSAYNAYPAENDVIIFPSLGNSRYGTLFTRNGSAVAANHTYTFRDWIDMYFVPSAAGVYTMTYQFRHGSTMMSGTIKITVQAASMTVTMNQAALRMAPYSSQYISLAIEPAAADYRVQWSSSDTRVATVVGSNAAAVVNSVGNGTATITAVVTDGRGFEIRRSCTVLVTSGGSNFDPTVSTTLGIPYVGTGTSSAMRSQFAALYNTTLNDNAIIRFASSGNTDVAVMRLADGSMIRPDVNYTLAQYVAMYTQPVSAGVYSVPYTLTYAGKELNGTVSVIVSAANISTNLTLPADTALWFSAPMGSSTAGTLFAESIRNTIGSNWSYVRFGSVSDIAGTLYLDQNRTAIGASTNITPAMMAQLYFVPGGLGAVFTAPYTVYTATGSVIATGTLNITRPSITGFVDVPANAYYAQAVNWAVGRGITSGMSSTSFSPNTTVTRGQAVTFLWRAAGQPKALAAFNPFTDVPAGSYYYDAVLWAVQQGITNGTSETAFSPESQLNRDQLLTFLCRASGSYADGADWSQMAVNWANTHGLLTGVPGAFTAASACPRSDVVYYIWKNYNA